MKALIFDCDGVLVDTERDGHRIAFNQAFAEYKLEVHWDVTLYGQLLKIAGGKERMHYYFDQYGWPEGIHHRDSFIKNLHALKTKHFMRIIETGQLPLRSGVERLIDEAIKADVKLAVCSTSNKEAVASLVETMLGPERKAIFSALLAGDVVSQKKPDPEIYNLAMQQLGVQRRDCVVIEDSRNGLLAAKGAGMCCLITVSTYTSNEDFSEADKVVAELGDPPREAVLLEDLQKLLQRARAGQEIRR